jgi:peroxiredoxin Q/BCP
MDSVERQSQFTEKNQLDYPLLADVDGTVARLFGVKRTLDVLKVKRSTFVIARDRRVVDVIHSETNMNAHASRALEALRALG